MRWVGVAAGFLFGVRPHVQGVSVRGTVRPRFCAGLRAGKVCSARVAGTPDDAVGSGASLPGGLVAARLGRIDLNSAVPPAG